MKVSRTVSFTMKGLGIDSLVGRTVDVWWTDSTHFDGAFADPLVVPDVLVTVCLFADALISKRNRDGTFEVKYNDGDVDRWGYAHTGWCKLCNRLGLRAPSGGVELFGRWELKINAHVRLINFVE